MSRQTTPPDLEKERWLLESYRAMSANEREAIDLCLLAFHVPTPPPIRAAIQARQQEAR